MAAPEKAQAETLSTKKPHRNSRQVGTEVVGRVDLAKALTLRFRHNLSYSAIGSQFNTSAQAVEKRIKKFLPFLNDPEAIEQYETNKASLLSAAEFRLLQATVDESKIKAASLNNVAYAFQQVSNFNRLARGESTTNVSVQSIVKHHSTVLADAKVALDSLLDVQDMGTVACQAVDTVDNTPNPLTDNE